MIRPIAKNDNPFLAQLIREVFEEHEAPKEGTVYSDPTTDQLYQLFQTKNSACFVLEENNVIGGCCGIFPTKGLPKDHVELLKFYLHPSFRGKGLGKALFEKCLIAAKIMGYAAVYIESQEVFKKAVQLYKSYGFKHLPAALGNSGHYNCRIWMLKKM